MNDMVYWSPRGIGCDGVPCFVTKNMKCDLRSNISGFVSSREDADKVVNIFGGYARLDFRAHEPNWIQVKVGVEKEHTEVLDRLMAACSDTILTPKKLAWAVNPAENRDGEPATVRIARAEGTKSYAVVAKRVQEIYDEYDIRTRGLGGLMTIDESKYGHSLQISAHIMDRYVREANAYGEKFWDWFCARNPLLDGKAPAQVFPVDSTAVYNAAKEYFKKEE